MKNFIQEPDIIEITAPVGGVASGDGVVEGSLFGVAVTTAAEGETVNVQTTGVFSLPKSTSTTFASGGKVSFDISLRKAVSPGSGKYPIGCAIASAGNGATSVKVRLDGTSTEAA